MKRQVQAAFFDAGLTLEREALGIFVAFVEENGGEEELIYSLLDSTVQGVLCVIPKTLYPAHPSPSSHLNSQIHHHFTIYALYCHMSWPRAPAGCATTILWPTNQIHNAAVSHVAPMY